MDECASDRLRRRYVGLAGVREPLGQTIGAVQQVDLAVGTSPAAVEEVDGERFAGEGSVPTRAAELLDVHAVVRCGGSACWVRPREVTTRKVLTG